MFLIPGRIFLICNLPLTCSKSLIPNSFAIICAAPSLEINPESCSNLVLIFASISEFGKPELSIIFFIISS